MLREAEAAEPSWGSGGAAELAQRRGGLDAVAEKLDALAASRIWHSGLAEGLDGQQAGGGGWTRLLACF